MSTAFESLCDHVRDTAKLNCIQELLEWDERCKMPPKGGEYRADQVALIAKLSHQRSTDERVGDWLEQLSGDPLAKDENSDSGATIRLLRKSYEKQKRIPESLIEELTRYRVLGQQAWVEARKNDDFSSFAPTLEKIIDLTKQMADAIGYEDCRYDALLDEYEPQATTKEVAQTLGGLRTELVPLIQAIKDSGKKAPIEIIKRIYPREAQERFGRKAATAIGFDFEAGRLDVTQHPFCMTGGRGDIRITTRYDERFFNSAFFGTLHEAGHGIYEQGLRPEFFGLPPGKYCSLGIHESQSRLFENFVGRSRSFWEHFYPAAQNEFKEALTDVSLDDFYFAVNDVRPSLIRVEADEATYNLHIIIRFELEQSLINEDMPIADLPAAWREKYREYLGIEPPDDADGVLQDVHWSAALIGYFPTYALGNIYAGQFFEKASEEIGNVDQQFANGDFAPLREWFVENVHKPGQCYPATELVKRVTGKPLSHDGLIRYLKAKLEPLYGM